MVGIKVKWRVEFARGTERYLSYASGDIHSSIMIPLRIMLMFMTIIALVYSFPTEGAAGNNISIKIPENATARPSYQSEQSSVIHVGDNNFTDKPQVIQFVLNGQDEKTKIETTGTDREKYIINQISDQKIHKITPNPEIKKKESIHIKENSNQNTNRSQKIDSNANSEIRENGRKFLPSQIEYKLEQKWPLANVEISSLDRGFPKYFYDVFNPLLPFPEITEGKSRQNTEQGLQREKEIRVQQQAKFLNKPPEDAGPLLNPLSIFSREFDIPFFD